MTVAAAADPRRRRSARRVLWLLALICIAPIVASYVAYYWLRPAAHVNYGELLGARPGPEIAGIGSDGTPMRLSALRGRWLLLFAGEDSCDARCERELYATRQAWMMQGAQRERAVRVWLRPATAAAPAAELLAQHPDIIVIRGDPRQWATLPGAGPSNIYLLDPLGNRVLRYPADPDIRGMAKDLERLLRASQIG